MTKAKINYCGKLVLVLPSLMRNHNWGRRVVNKIIRINNKMAVLNVFYVCDYNYYWTQETLDEHTRLVKADRRCVSDKTLNEGI